MNAAITFAAPPTNFAAQRLCAFWYGPAYYDGLAVAFSGRLHWPNRRIIAAK